LISRMVILSISSPGEISTETLAVIFNDPWVLAGKSCLTHNTLVIILQHADIF